MGQNILRAFPGALGGPSDLLPRPLGTRSSELGRIARQRRRLAIGSRVGMLDK